MSCAWAAWAYPFMSSRTSAASGACKSPPAEVQVLPMLSVQLCNTDCPLHSKSSISGSFACDMVQLPNSILARA